MPGLHSMLLRTLLKKQTKKKKHSVSSSVPVLGGMWFRYQQREEG